MTEQDENGKKQSSIIKVLREWDIVKVRTEEPPQPLDTLREINDLYTIIKVHLAAVVMDEIQSGKIKVKDVVSLTRELEKLAEMLFVFKVKLGELGQKDKPKKSELVMEVLSDLSERDKLKISQMLENEIQLQEEEEEQDGSET